jgi:hypothetical protein
VDIGQADWNPLLVRDVDASDSRHLRISSNVGKAARTPPTTDGLY